MAIPSVTANATAWKKTAKAVVARRAELDLTVRDCVTRAQGGISVETWSKLENPKGAQSMSVRSLAAASRALGWSHDSLERLLAGQEPVSRDGVMSEEGFASRELAFRGWAIEKQLRDMLFRQEELEAHLARVEGLVGELATVLQESRRDGSGPTGGGRSSRSGQRNGRSKR